MIRNSSESASARPAIELAHVIRLRVRYGETDQMGTVYNSRPLDWFECGRSELLRDLGIPYADLERKGLFLPLIEAHLEYLGRARYDDLLEVATVLTIERRVRLRCSVEVVQAESRKPVVRGYTLHVFTDPNGKPLRPPAWLLKHLEAAMRGRGGMEI